MSGLLAAVSCDGRGSSGSGRGSTAPCYTVVRSTFSNDVFLTGTAEAVRTATLICPDELRWMDAVISYLAEDGAMVSEGDTVCVLECQRLLQEEETLKNLIETNQAAYDLGVANLRSEYARLEAEARSNELQAALSDLDSLQMLYYTASQRKIAELNLRKARINQQKLQRNLDVTRLVNETELKKLDMQLRQSQEMAEYYQQLLDELVITAPAGGMFLRADSWSLERKYEEGDEVQEKVLARIPDISEMQIAIAAPEQAYKQLVIGQQVSFTFDAMPGCLAYGRISQKSPVGRPLKRNSSLTVYDVTATVDSADVFPVPGFTANCKVNISTLRDTFPVPLVTVFDRDSLKVVYVRSGKKYIEREVRTAGFSAAEVVISAGLMGGEQLAYVRPKPSAIVRTERLAPETSAGQPPANGRLTPEAPQKNQQEALQKTKQEAQAKTKQKRSHQPNETKTMKNE